jgi:hypothetical protein
MKALLLFLLATPLYAQTYVPTTYMATLTSPDNGVTWESAAGVLGGSPTYVPTIYAAALCQSAAGQPWQLCSFGGGGGAVSITSPAASLTLTPSPLTGTGTADINLAHTNIFTAAQTVPSLNFTGTSTQALIAQGGSSYFNFQWQNGHAFEFIGTGQTLAVQTTWVFAWLSGAVGTSPIEGLSIKGYGSHQAVAAGNGTAGDTSWGFAGSAFISGSTKFTASGCSNSATVGGASAGQFASGTSGTCTVVITIAGASGILAPSGWACHANDLTTPADIIVQSATTQTTATLTGTTVTGDTINFACTGY